tara:strand:+ start:69 stop:299 length:231 start_codon:yes stop_codon:yes gene_type:complete
MKSNIQSMRERIKNAPDQDALSKVGASLERLYNNGIFTAEQLLELDHELFHRFHVIEQEDKTLNAINEYNQRFERL